ncbi:DUF91 domain-containing protein [bacterium]|nr:DUF91 domain-containing protein [bacterium]
MTLFTNKNGSLEILKKKDFRNEKELQRFVESNLETLFNVRFLATEFVISEKHGGRIDSLGLDDNDSPVIIEYKWGEKDNIINQGLFYLDWLIDHKGDFQVLVEKILKEKIQVEYGSPRLILIAQSFNKYDQFAINRMAENIELWTYSLYENNTFELRSIATSQAKKNKDTSASKVTQISYDDYSVDRLLEKAEPNIKELFDELRERVLNFESEQEIEELPRKHYVAYRTNRAFLYVSIQVSALKIHIIINQKDLNDPKGMTRDVSKVGHYGYGNTEIILKSMDDLEYVMSFVKQSYLESC